jgi:cytidylate kinase
MGRKKLDEKEVEERRIEQQAICHLITQRRPNMTHAEIEVMLNIANHAKDGAVFRRISRAKQLSSSLKINDIIRICGEENIFTYEEVMHEMQDFYKKRDDEVLQSHLSEWKERINQIATMSLDGDAKFKDEIVQSLEDAIKIIKGIKK